MNVFKKVSLAEYNERLKREQAEVSRVTKGKSQK